MQEIDLSQPLSLRTAFRFPLQSAMSRREVAIGGLWLLVPVVGWILNMGHRIQMTHRMQSGLPAWPAWTHYRVLWRHGLITFLGMIEYHLPATICGYFAWRNNSMPLWIASIALWLLATIAVPGYMTHYCRTLDPREVFDPFLAMRRVFQGGAGYWHAWGIALAALVLSFVGLIGLGVGFLFTSVWFWQVAGFSFATVFTQRFQLSDDQK